MDILFVWPSNPEYINKKNFSMRNLIKKNFSSGKPLTFQILAALTPEKYNLYIVEGGPDDIDYNQKYDLVAITTHTYTVNNAYKIADEFRRRKNFVVLGGFHASALPKEAIQHADSVLIGESEETWPQFLKDLEKGKTKRFYIPERPVDPKIIPTPQNIYQIYTGNPTQATRGCPNGCKFCPITNSLHGRIYRKRPIENVIEEIQSFPGKVFNFNDTSLTIDVEYTKQLFRELKNINKKFGALGNINILSKDDEFLKLAEEAGCVSWFVGFESISQKAIENIGKKTNKVNDYLAGIKKIHDHGMSISGSFIFGFDSDTLDIFKKTDEFIARSEIDILEPNVLTPYPGTPLYIRLEKEGRLLTKDWSKYDQEQVVFQPKNMTPEELYINTRNIHRKWHKTSAVLKRVFYSGKLGYYPFVNTIFGNIGNKYYYFIQ